MIGDKFEFINGSGVVTIVNVYKPGNGYRVAYTYDDEPEKFGGWDRPSMAWHKFKKATTPSK
jgi:hypothetical protein